MSEALDPVELGRRPSRSLDRHGVSHAIGGTLAYGIWGIPRTTLDLDMNVFVEPHDLDPVFAASTDDGGDDGPDDGAPNEICEPHQITH